MTDKSVEIVAASGHDYQNITKVLVANRGEIARRIFRTVKAEGLGTVAIYVHEDRNAPHVKEADQAVELQGDDPIGAYMDAAQIIEICQRTGANAVHPGYGFLAENADFARQVTAAGLIFIGPSPDSIELMGDKVRSREFAAANDCPIAPSVVQTGDMATFIAEARDKVGFPLLVKASAGGGGKGMTIVHDPSEFEEKARVAASEAERYFGDPRIYAERYLQGPRHIEVQVLGDGTGKVLHLFERECSIQRRFQKVIEEAPAPNLDADVRSRLLQAAVNLASGAKYKNAGTVEFIVDASNEFYFLEMNTRLQVEHPVTELVTGLDLVAEQLKIADGATLALDQGDVTVTGHAIECRIAAEEPDHDFRPAIGRVMGLAEPVGEGIRVDGGLLDGQVVSPSFDPMLAKLITFGADRDQATERMVQALAGYAILGLPTNIAFLKQVMELDTFRAGKLTTGFIPENIERLKSTAPDQATLDAALVVAALSRPEFFDSAFNMPEPYASMGGWRN